MNTKKEERRAEKRKKIRLRGCLWEPGVNGLGVRGFHHLPYRKRFDFPARLHDELYDKGGTWKDRRSADIMFLLQCIDCCWTGLQVTVAVAYYYVVRLLGWAFFRYER